MEISFEEVWGQSDLWRVFVMILVSLGTHERQFYRLLKEIEILISEGKIKDVIIQTGYTSYKVKGAKCFDFIEFGKMQKYIRNCNCLITHGGVGSITDALNYGKTTIVVPRRKELNEHTDNHQLQITKEMEKIGKIIPVYNIKNLENAIAKARKLKVKKRIQKIPKTFKIIDKKLKEWETI